jgi:hypothetical protein
VLDNQDFKQTPNFKVGCTGPGNKDLSTSSGNYTLKVDGDFTYTGALFKITILHRFFLSFKIGEGQFHGTLSNQTLNRITPNVIEGYYLEQVMTNQGVYKSKVYLKRLPFAKLAGLDVMNQKTDEFTT